MQESWLLWRDHMHDPFFNMAADELLLQMVQTLQQPILRTYFWDRKAASIGYAQRWGIVDNSYTVVRRPTGGGVVFHDIDLTYTLVFPATHYLARMNTEACYEKIHAALSVLMGDKTALLDTKLSDVDHSMMRCFTSPSKFDVMQEGHKAAGAAQKRSKEGVLHQGSILLSVTHGNVQALCNLVENAFRHAFNVEYKLWEPTELQIKEMSMLGENKYDTELWSLKRRVQEA